MLKLLQNNQRKNKRKLKAVMKIHQIVKKLPRKSQQLKRFQAKLLQKLTQESKVKLKNRAPIPIMMLIAAVKKKHQRKLQENNLMFHKKEINKPRLKNLKKMKK